MTDNNISEQVAFDKIKIGLASPEKIREWSKGEVTKPETINYRTLKPEKDGLFCEKIFGPSKDWECHCGKYKKIRYKGVICDRCGVEVTKASVRRERMGRVELAAPVSHIWYFKGIPSRMGLILDISPKVLEKVLYFASYIVLDPMDTNLEYKQVLSEKEFREAYEEYAGKFRVGMGAEAIKELLAAIDLDKEAEELKAELFEATGQKKTKIVKRLEVMEAFRSSGNKPEWMILDVVPVIPPDLRPMVQLDGDKEPKQRIYAARTKDFHEFTKAQVYLEKDNHVIDSTMVYDDGVYYRFSKDETTKNIKTDTAPDLNKESFTDRPVPNLEAIYGVEGPEIYYLEDQKKWCLIIDRFATHKGYLPLVCDSLKTMDFKPLDESEFDMGKTMKRHGSVVVITDAEYDRMAEAFRLE